MANRSESFFSRKFLSALILIATAILCVAGCGGSGSSGSSSSGNGGGGGGGGGGSTLTAAQAAGTYSGTFTTTTSGSGTITITITSAGAVSGVLNYTSGSNSGSGASITGTFATGGTSTGTFTGSLGTGSVSGKFALSGSTLTTTLTVTPTGSTATTISGTLAKSSGLGILPANVIFYNDVTVSGTTTLENLIQCNPDGSGIKVLASLNSANFQGISLNPAVSGQMVFGYAPAGGASPVYGIYENTSLSATGATTIVAPAYSFISSIQVSVDGEWVYFIAATSSTANSELYRVPITGGTPTVLDSDNIFTMNVDIVNGSMITYDKAYTYSNGNQEYAIFSLSTTGGTPTLLTNDSSADYMTPQFSKDGTKIVLVSDKLDSDGEVYVMNPDGSGLVQVTNSPTIYKIETGVTYSASGTQAAYVGLGADPSGNGVYVTGTIGSTPGTDTFIVPDEAIANGIYWTANTGRSRSGSTAYLSKKRKKGLLL